MDAIYRLLAAERRARAMVLALSQTPIQALTLNPRPDWDGCMLLALARQALRFGAQISVAVPPDSDAEDEAWRTLWDSAVKLALIAPDVQPDMPDNSIRLFFNDATDNVITPPYPDDLLAWRVPLADSGLFVRQARPDEPGLTAEQSRTIDRVAIQRYGVPGICLMENAALDAAAVAVAMLRQLAGGNSPDGGNGLDAKKVLVVAGGGNNGGDGFALARCLADIGVAVTVALVKDAGALKGDARINYAILTDLARIIGIPIHHLHRSPERLAEITPDHDLVVDALLGTGFSGDVSPEFACAITSIRSAGVPVLALDLPSGLHADTGTASGPVVRADTTITFAGVKKGLLTETGRDVSGAVLVGDIGAPPQAMR